MEEQPDQRENPAGQTVFPEGFGTNPADHAKDKGKHQDKGI